MGGILRFSPHDMKGEGVRPRECAQGTQQLAINPIGSIYIWIDHSLISVNCLEIGQNTLQQQQLQPRYSDSVWCEQTTA